MKRVGELAGSIPILTATTVFLVLAMVLYIQPASRHIAEISQSVTQNFYLLGGFMLLLMLAGLAETLLVVRLVWGPGVTPRDAGLGDEDGDIDEVRAMRVTGTKKALVFFVLIAVNTFVFDWIGKGVIVSDTRAYHVLTLLRSEDGQNRADAVNDAVMLTGDKRIAEALGIVLSTPGEAREWAAYAAGVRTDTELSDSLLGLLKRGKSHERAAAAVALARLKDPRIIGLSREVYPEMESAKGDLIMAMGMIGKDSKATKSDAALAGAFLAELLQTDELDKELKRVVIWALGEFSAPEGLLPIENLLDRPGDNATFCIGLEALGKIGSADTSLRLVKALYEIDKTLQCPELVYRDSTGHEVLICSRLNIIERLLYEIANIGDRRALPAMEKLVNDKTFSKRAREMAGEIAFQMKYKKMESPGI